MGIGIGGYTAEEIPDQQTQDPDLKLLLGYLRGEAEPSEGTLFLSSPMAKHYWVHRDIFELGPKGLIFKKTLDKKNARLVTPRKYQTEVISLCHDLPAAGHQGGKRTLERVKQRLYWKNMYPDIKNLCPGM